MSILDIDSQINNEYVIIQQWLKDNCAFIGCYPEIIDNIVNIKIDRNYEFHPIFKITTCDSKLPSYFKFGECEKLGRKGINVTLMDCHNLVNFSGLPNNIKRLYIHNCESIHSVEGLPEKIKIIDLNDCMIHNCDIAEKISKLHYKISWC